MRIIAGSARGRRLYTLKGLQTRPTADRVKEAVFSILAGKIAEKKVLDAFAGSGALGLEALSRGASIACFLEKNREAAQICKKNIDLCALKGARLYQGDIFEILPRLRKNDPQLRFDLIFLDPPYQSDLLERSIRIIIKDGWLAEKGLIIAESASEKARIQIDTLELWKEKKYSDTIVRLYTIKTSQLDNKLVVDKS